MFVAADDQTIDLLDGLLTLDPSKRLTCAAALEHPFFTTPSDDEWAQHRVAAEAHVLKLPAMHEEHERKLKEAAAAKSQTRKRTADMDLDDATRKKLF